MPKTPENTRAGSAGSGGFSERARGRTGRAGGGFTKNDRDDDRLIQQLWPGGTSTMAPTRTTPPPLPGAPRAGFSDRFQPGLAQFLGFNIGQRPAVLPREAGGGVPSGLPVQLGERTSLAFSPSRGLGSVASMALGPYGVAANMGADLAGLYPDDWRHVSDFGGRSGPAPNWNDPRYELSRDRNDARLRALAEAAQIAAQAQGNNAGILAQPEPQGGIAAQLPPWILQGVLGAI